ncbi:MAG: hypothetical protein RR840_03955 [Clostridium sp.]
MGVSIEFLVKHSSRIYYCGQSELEAYRCYKNLKVATKNIYKAKVNKEKVNGVPFIFDYEILETIR